jgi:hypothetical protein
MDIIVIIDTLRQVIVYNRWICIDVQKEYMYNNNNIIITYTYIDNKFMIIGILRKINL